MMYKFMTVFSLLTILFGISTGCGKKENVDKDETKIRWIADPNPIRKEQISIAERQNPDIKVELDWSSVGLQKVLTQIAGNTPADIFMVYEWPDFVMLAEKGVLEDLTPYCKKYNIDLDDFWPSLKPFIYYKDRVYALPEMCSVPVLYYNRRLFREIGIPYPTYSWTWNDFLETARRLVQRDTSGRILRYGFMPYNFWNVICLIALQKDANFFTADGSRCIVDSLAFKEAAQFFYDLIFEYKVTPTVTEAQNIAPSGTNLEGNLFGTEKLGMIISERPCTIFIRNYKNLDWAIAPLPQSGNKKMVYVNTHACVIPKGARNKDAAFRFLKSLISDEAELLVSNYGEGIPSRKSIALREEFLFNPVYPNETSNIVYLNQMEYSAWLWELSPHISPLQVNRIRNEEMESLLVQKQTVEETLGNIAKRVNEIIQTNLKSNQSNR